MVVSTVTRKTAHSGTRMLCPPREGALEDSGSAAHCFEHGGGLHLYGMVDAAAVNE